jgi:ribosome-binding factor A
MDMQFENRHKKAGSVSQFDALVKIRTTSRMRQMCEIAFNYDLENSTRLDQLFDDIEKVKMVWEYIFLTYTS